MNSVFSTGTSCCWFLGQGGQNRRKNWNATKQLPEIGKIHDRTAASPYSSKYLPHWHYSCPALPNQTAPSSSITHWIWWRPLQRPGFSHLVSDLHATLPRFFLLWPDKNHLGSVLHEIQQSSKVGSLSVQMGRRPWRILQIPRLGGVL